MGILNTIGETVKYIYTQPVKDFAQVREYNKQLNDENIDKYSKWDIKVKRNKKVFDGLESTVKAVTVTALTVVLVKNLMED